jgi:hypothetical protein
MSDLHSGEEGDRPGVGEGLAAQQVGPRSKNLNQLASQSQAWFQYKALEEQERKRYAFGSATVDPARLRHWPEIASSQTQQLLYNALRDTS